jgi:ArsR family transcriptional regulator
MDKRLITMETLFKALADRTRLRILGLLSEGDVCVCHIHESLALPQPTVSRHLAYLRRAGLVLGRKDGLWVHYRLADLPDPVAAVLFAAATHAVGHLNTTAKDVRRLATRYPAGSVAPARRRVVRPCCAAEAVDKPLRSVNAPDMHR